MSRLHTRVALFSATTLAATAAVASLAVGSSSATPAGFAPDHSTAPTVAAVADAKKGITLRGALQDGGALSRSDLQGLTQQKIKQQYMTSKGTQKHAFTGPLLLDILNDAKPDFSTDQHDPLRFVILAKASDNFLAALSWGEIATDLANKRVIVALTEDGKRLDRPRLVIPGDKHGARQVYDLVSITLVRLGPAANHVRMDMGNMDMGNG
ncbi:MAG TPA: hypothetical protein VMZ00_04600 [Sporichthya sp.]|nr:hypothetical protein [Sporichthya sp.]